MTVGQTPRQATGQAMPLWLKIGLGIVLGLVVLTAGAASMGLLVKVLNGQSGLAALAILAVIAVLAVAALAANHLWSRPPRGLAMTPEEEAGWNAWRGQLFGSPLLQVFFGAQIYEAATRIEADGSLAGRLLIASAVILYAWLGFWGIVRRNDAVRPASRAVNVAVTAALFALSLGLAWIWPRIPLGIRGPVVIVAVMLAVGGTIASGLRTRVTWTRARAQRLAADA